MAIELQRIKALCFDVDGTLSDTDDQYTARLAAKLPFPNAEELARKVIMWIETPGNVLFGLPDRFGLDDELNAIGEWFYQRGYFRKEHDFEIVPGTTNSLAQLDPHFPMCVVTARGPRGTLAFLEQYELSRFFQRVAHSQTAKRTKPYPDPILWCAEQLNVRPEECLMIGDTTVDILAGKRAGVQTVGVLSGFGEEAELRRAGADEILPSVAELPDLLRPN